MKLTEIK